MSDPQAVMRELLAEIERVLPTVTWKPAPSDISEQARREYDARFFEGHTPDGAWHLMAADFSIENQGFPPGSRGHDGCGRKGGDIIRFTRPLAEKVFQAALTSQPQRDTNGPHGE